MSSKTFYKRPEEGFRLQINRTLQGDALNESLMGSYEQLVITERLRLLTKGEAKRKNELERTLLKKGLLIG